MKLVIVESPTKAKTISRFLGNGFSVTSSYGHIRDLPKSKLGVDIENNFAPQYVIPTKSRKQVTALKKALKDADEVVLATDEDREGEAIAWHILYALGLEGNKKPHKASQRGEQDASSKKISRIVFHEITEPAIKEALANPRELDQGLIDAQQARRVLDRLVGYSLSPLLWKKVMRGLSAGRVQSVTLRLVVERERERQAFKPQEYWSVEACLRRQADLNTAKKEIFKAKLWKRDGKILKDLELDNEKDVDSIVKDLENAQWSVESVTKKERKRSPMPPFATSTLQQAASSRLGYSARQTMVVAQQLYEGIKLSGGQEGLITYMRTDSLSISPSASTAAEDFIKQEYGPQYSKPTAYKTKSKGAQEAHESIRPTSPARTPESIKDALDPKQFKLYQLIWQRFMASQMASAVFDATTVEITPHLSASSRTGQAGLAYTFKSTGQTQKFDGFLRVWPVKSSAVELPELASTEKLELKELLPERHETEPPPRYSEATLVKALEENGIGRPSTYAPTMGTIQARGYVERDDNKKLFPTDVGFVVNDLLVEHFPKIVDVNFTAGMEADLDEIAEGKKDWVPTIREFYEPFAKTIEEKQDKIQKSEVRKDIPTDKVCPKCGKPIIIKFGRFGKFYACSGFPECKHTENFANKIDMICPECNEGDIVLKKTKKKRTFYGCFRYPDCKYASWKDPREPVKEKKEKED